MIVSGRIVLFSHEFSVKTTRDRVALLAFPRPRARLRRTTNRACVARPSEFVMPRAPRAGRRRPSGRPEEEVVTVCARGIDPVLVSRADSP